jgi:hypothetical protein
MNGKKALRAPSAAHCNLVFPDFEPLERFFFSDLQRFPANVDYPPGVFVDAMVVRLDVGLEYHNPLSELLRLEEALLGKLVEGVVHSGTRSGWTATSHVHPYFIHGRMDVGAQNKFGDGNALRGGFNSRFAKPVAYRVHSNFEYV